MGKYESILERLGLFKPVEEGAAEPEGVRPSAPVDDKNALNTEQDRPSYEDGGQAEASFARRYSDSYRAGVRSEVDEIVGAHEKTQNGKEEYNSYIRTDEIYARAGITNTELESAFMLDELIKIMPEKLTADMKRKGILDVTSMTRLSVGAAKKDVLVRMKALNEYIDNFSRRTNEVMKENDDQIEQLKKLITEHERVKSERSLLHDKQIADVEMEINRIIMEFMFR